MPSSLFMHGVALAVAHVWLVGWSDPRPSAPGQRVALLLVEQDDLEESLEVVEPLSALEVPEVPLEPELVETPPVYPAPPEPVLEWIPPVDLLASVESFKWAPREDTAPEPAVEEFTPEPPPVQAAETQPTVGDPQVLEGPSLPEVLEAPAPRYPRQALRLGWEGTVTVLATVDATGRVSSARIEVSSGRNVLDEEALDVFRRWLFCERRPSDPEQRLVRKRFSFRLP